ncbi:MAG TPA: SDR family NAD(P)-dependent oxidoreductase [Solirubrobacteraceae bacterium]|jgi:short-subunit dehydrogenase
MKISGANVLLTGATGGIGHAIARALTAQGAKLVLTGRRADVLEPLAEELDARAIAVDLVEPGEVDRLVGEAGDVDIVIANAALPATGALDSFTMHEIDRALAVNLRAPIALTHALLPAMVARGRGHLVYVSSLSGKAATPVSLMYTTTKFGLRGFAAGLRIDLRASGVGVTTVLPGFIRDAGMFAVVGAKLPATVGTRTPEDVARATIRGIERNKGEIDVAPLPVRVGAMIASVAPEFGAAVSRRSGGDKVADEMAAGQAGMR